MEVWSHNGKLYEVISFYSIHDDAWQYELSGVSGKPGTGPYLSVSVPDATPDDGSFTPGSADDIMVYSSGSAGIPWPILRRFVELVELSGAIHTGEAGAESGRFGLRDGRGRGLLDRRRGEGEEFGDLAYRRPRSSEAPVD